MKQYGSAIGSKREKITSKKATAPFLVGSIISSLKYSYQRSCILRGMGYLAGLQQTLCSSVTGIRRLSWTLVLEKLYAHIEYIICL